MSTPLQLKRKTPQLLSTYDRTVNTKVTLAELAPVFSPSKTVKIHKTKYAATLPSHKNLEESTVDLEEKVGQTIERDEDRSEFRGHTGVRDKRYAEVSANLKIGMAGIFAIPDEVKALHNQESLKMEGQPSYNRGCLAELGIYYFAVENHVLLYDIGRAARTGKSLDDCLLHKLQFPERVFQLKQITWAPPTMTYHQQRTLILVSTPWQLQFATLERSHSRPAQPVQTIHWAKVTLLPYYFSVASMRASFLTQGNRQLFYTDEAGHMVRLAFQSNDMFGKIFNGNKFKSSSQTSTHKLTKNYFHTHRRASIMDKIRHFSKVVITEARGYFKLSPEIFGLAYYKKKELLFSLIDLYPDRTGPITQYSFSKMLTCWKVEKGELVMKSQVSQLQLLSSTQNEQIFSHNIGKNNRIAKLLPINQSNSQKSCLLLVLTNGIRLFVSLQDNIFQVDSYEYPPSFEAKKHKRQRKGQQYLKPVDLIHFQPEGHAHLMTIRQDGESHSFFIWKENQLSQEECVSDWSWSESMWDGNVGQPPAESMLYRSSLGLLALKKNQLLRSWELEQKKRVLLDARKVNYLHSLARDVYSEPSLFIHATDIYIEYFFIYRPLDLAVMAIRAEVYEPDLFFRIIPCFDRKQLQGLLLQILCDNEGVYIRDPELVECMNNYASKNEGMGAKAMDFETHRAEFFRKNVNRMRKRGRQVEQKLQLTAETQDKTRRLMLQLGNQSTDKYSNQKDNYQKQASSVFECIITYIARLMRFIWSRDVSQLSPQTYELVSLLQPILTTIDRIFSPEYLAKVHSQTIKNDIIQHKFLNLNKKQRKDENIEKVDDLVDKLKLFINKIIQLVLLGSQTKVHLKRKFYACLSMKAEAFQEVIFNQLTLNHLDPLRSLGHYRTLFPLFIGCHLEKSLKIYQETLKLNKSHTSKTLQAHHHLPQYLLDQIQVEKGLKPAELAALSKKEQILKVSHLSGSREAIQELKNKAQQEHMECGEREHVLLILESQLRLYLQNKRGSKDNFYLSTSKEIQELSNVVAMQRLLLDQYRREQNLDPWVLDNLKYSLLTFDGLRDVVSSTHSLSFQIIFHYYFKPDQSDVSKLFEQLFIECYEKYDKDGKKNSFFGKIEKSWNCLQRRMDLIIGKVRKSIDIKELVSILISSQESARRQYFATNLQQWSIQNSLQNLISFLTDQKNKKGLKTWVEGHKIPVVSLMLVKSGLEQKKLESAYLENLHDHLYSQKALTTATLPLLQSLWINLYCILLQYPSQLSQFSSKTEKFSKLKINGLIQGCTSFGKSMKQLLHLLKQMK